MNIGFIGTGTMGLPMLTNLMKKGHSVVAFDVVASALAAAVGRGARAAKSAADTARQCDIVVTMLPS